MHQRLDVLCWLAQSLVLSFDKSDDPLDYGGIESNQGIAIKKSFSVLPNDKKNSYRKFAQKLWRLVTS